MTAKVSQLRPHIYLPGKMYVGKRFYANELKEYYLGLARYVPPGQFRESVIQLFGIGCSFDTEKLYNLKILRFKIHTTFFRLNFSVKFSVSYPGKMEK